ncbi:MAG: prolipoprotein diacylglyceryl transferase [Chlamydiia bacterium]|nr:prolipoprotein diacylglyceryl transferase [Chlamydiia bacterium]
MFGIGAILSYLYWDPDATAFTIPLIERPVAWYGILFALGFFVGFYLLLSLLKRYLRASSDWPEETLKKKARVFAERLTVYVIISTVIGARLGHVLFYEKWTDYLAHPIEIIKTWEGGLASHGGVVGILIGLILFYLRSRKEFPMISFRRIVDLMVVPALFASSLIRLGNFINQEVLGIETAAPWGVVFGHPIDGSIPAVRHPAQLYEALFYFGAFLVFWRLFSRLNKPVGLLSGLFFIVVFSFRFFIEFLKEEHSHLMEGGLITMGQWLSLPLVALGIAFIVLSRKGQEGESGQKV